MTLCFRCHIREATMTWIGDGGTLAIMHGCGEPYCERCVVESQLAYIRILNQQVPELERRLEALVADHR